jgi:hypothetical protein
MAILGYSTKGGSAFGAANNYALYARYQTDASGGTTNLLHANIHNPGAGALNIKMAIYADVAGPYPGSQILAAINISVPGFNDGEVTGAYVVALSANTYYWIVINEEGGTDMWYDTTGGTSGYYNEGSFILPSPFADGVVDRAWQWSMWATYSSGGGGGGISIPKAMSIYNRRRRTS